MRRVDRGAPAAGDDHQGGHSHSNHFELVEPPAAILAQPWDRGASWHCTCTTSPCPLWVAELEANVTQRMQHGGQAHGHAHTITGAVKSTVTRARRCPLPPDHSPALASLDERMDMTRPLLLANANAPG